MATQTQVAEVTDWVARHGFERVALQFPDAMLADAVGFVKAAREALPQVRFFILGDSSFGGGGVDEVGALHYGADCIVRFGHADQQRGGSLPVLFVLGSGEGSSCQQDAEKVARALDGLGNSEVARLVVISDLQCQHLAEPLAKVLARRFEGEHRAWQVLVARPRMEAFSGDVPAWHDWRWGCLDLTCSWWANLGTLTLAGAARPFPLRACGREVAALETANVETGCQRALLWGRELPPHSVVLYVGAQGTSLERCILLRYGADLPVWRLQPGTAPDAQLERIFSHGLLQRRYRFVELARAAGTVGLLLVAAGGPTALGRALAQRLEFLLAKAGRKSYRLVVGQPTQEKLGNFPEIECYVLLSGPEQFLWEVRDLMVPVCTPFELEVALGAREWTGQYITDLEELLLSAPVTQSLPDGASTETVVQTLGAARLRHFGAEAQAPQPAQITQTTAQLQAQAQRPAPAEITPGLHGVPWKYSQEESFEH
ncbi:unnamed protein product [Effrenium voratum]|uniref:2-(3-amino-3-carboxypropyl)histidine synthase n=1 Tax=Effrenium voratum TaxID=2562239 RepID=A0AA36J3D0_9DINO|nr:unnamed protein product [Effrenium voratum]CAJ1459500.1 unnamed protein product [Effrenium voratum]